ncbi:uncharacterized protein LOC107435942 [Ziziphus jujuba]|uniref:Uncharacterized protein LOC107435942 n=1 Tax=Ziziphus jujuba TaxID=326968 RepID=A0ABM3IDP6_ZIZJJ|nr:uncharacterized protein LOC107435942 [Ziziphus jujuba]XP_048326199.2 uncharacterized protein LOC107435942 [Ziziphus jujuba]
MNFLVSIARKIAKYTVAPVGRQLGYIFHCGRNVDNLKTEVKDPKLTKKKREDLVVEAKRKGDEIRDHGEVDDKIFGGNKQDGLETILPSGSDQFPQLKEMELVDLPNLVSFYSRPRTPRFPSLEMIEVKGCLKMEVIFASKPLSLERTHESAHDDIPIQQPLFFVDKDAFPSLKSVRIEGMDWLKRIWQYELRNNALSFCKLEAVEVEKCKKLMGVFPFGMHRSSLGNLTRLEIRECERVEEIFEIQRYSNSEEEHHIIISNLKDIWRNASQGTFAFPNRIKKVEASKCPKLKAIFPPSVAIGLSQLEELHISECGIEEIVGKQQVLETVPPGHHFEFLELQKMYLKSLPNLVSFNERPHTSRFPLLRILEVKNCLKVKVFASEFLSFLSFQSKHGSTLDATPIQQPLFLLDNVAFPKLEELKIVSCEMVVKIFEQVVGKKEGQGTVPPDDESGFPRLKEIELKRLPNLVSFSKHGVPKPKKIIIDDIDYGESKREPKSESIPESETISSSSRTVDIDSIIAKHQMSHHPSTALQEL